MGNRIERVAARHVKPPEAATFPRILLGCRPEGKPGKPSLPCT
jgi:hypothetical protein